MALCTIVRCRSPQDSGIQADPEDHKDSKFTSSLKAQRDKGSFLYLFVGEHQQRGPQQPLLSQQGLQLPPAVLQPPLVRRVHHPDEAVSGLEIVPPIGSEGLLTSYVPDIELEPSVIQSLDIET